MNTLRYSLAAILAALKATGGQVYLAAKQLGCDPDTIYRRARRCPAITRTIAAARGELVDIAEVGLRKHVLDGDLDAIKFCLKTVGKERGYTERSEYDVNINEIDQAIRRELGRLAGAGESADAPAPAADGNGALDVGAFGR